MSKSTHYPLIADEFLKLNALLKDAELRVYLYLMVLNPFQNSVIEIDTAQISEQLGLTRRTIQRAIKRLQELHLIEVEITRFKYKKAVHGASSRLGSDDTRIASGDTRIASDDTRIASDDTRIASGDTRIASGDTRIASDDTRIATGDTRIASGDTRIADTPLKPLPDKDSSTPQINKIKDIHTLSELSKISEAERESFIEFGKKKAAQLPRPPELPLKWIEKNWEELLTQWLKVRDENENLYQKTKYNFAAYSEPQHQMWYGQLQVVASGVIELGDSTSLELWLKDDFNNSWLGWAKTARQDVREFWASHPILEQKSYGS